MLPDHTDILIVGAGPTGLALACALQQAGIDHVLVEERREAPNTSRAAVLHAHTLETLGAIGVAEALGAQGRALTRFSLRDRERPLLSIGFGRLPSAFRHILMIPQSSTEAILQARLEALGGHVRRGVAALRATREAEGATVGLSSADGERTIRARFVVAADGMHSLVRQAAGIGFHGEAYGDSFILADVRMEWPLGAEEVSLFFSAAGLAVVAPLPDGSFRVVATIDEAPEQPEIHHVQRILDERGPRSRACRVREVVWGSRFRVHHRLAERYRSGPFLLMGDAAHVHSPAGGQGMNTGLVDAIVLGEALTRVIRDGAPASVLDDYAAARRPAAEQVLALAARLTRIATLRSPPLRMLRNLVLRLLDHAEPFKRSLALGLSGIARRRLGLLPPAPATRPVPRDREASRAPDLGTRPLAARLAGPGR